MAERKVLMKGNSVALVGNFPEVGKSAPDCEVTTQDLKKVKISSFRGTHLLILSVPSLDTSVCSRETKTFNDALKSFGDQLNAIVISMDLPFAQSRFCAAENVKNVKVFSDFQKREFGEKFGVLMKDVGLLARAIFLLDEKGVVKYTHLVEEVTNEPPYQTIVDELKKFLSSKV